MAAYKNLIRQNILKLLIGLLIGAYIGIVFIGFFVFGGISRDMIFLDSFLKEITSSTENLAELSIIFVVFAVLGAFSSYIIILIRALKETTVELKVIREVDKTKDEFISMVLHHIRTPLSGMKWSLTEMVKTLKKYRREDFERLLKENDRTLNAVEHLVEASQASMGRVVYNFEVVTVKDLLRLIKDAVGSIEAAARAKGISLYVEMPPASEYSVKIDKEKITVIVQTLLSNAIAYTNKGGSITISTKEKQPLFLCHVSDTGMGIPQKDQTKVFLQFFRSENARRRKPEGFGIGLFIAKTFIKRHHGQIWFVSQEGKGTTFSFQLPLITVPTEKYLEKL